MRRLIVLLAAIAIVTLSVGGGVAIANHRAGHVAFTGRAMEAKTIQSDTVAQSTTSTTFVPLTGSGINFAVADGTTRLFEARFTAESQCAGGGAGNWCTAQIVVRNNLTGIVGELHPQAGGEFAFDSVGFSDDLWEGHAMERSIRLGPGRYTFFVQRRTTAATTTFRLDDWHFAVERIV